MPISPTYSEPQLLLLASQNLVMPTEKKSFVKPKKQSFAQILQSVQKQ